MTTKTEIQATAIYKVTIKETGRECYAVPSDSQPGTYYITCWNEQETRWTCTCEAGKYGKTCKHARAAQTSVVANKQAREDSRKPIATDQKGTLNGSCQGFSLMR